MAVFVWQSPPPRWFWSIPAVEGADGRSNLPSVYAEHVQGLILIFGTCANTDTQFDTGANPHRSEQDCRAVQNSQLLSCYTCESRTWQLATDDADNKMLTTFVWAFPDIHISLGLGSDMPCSECWFLVCQTNWETLDAGGKVVIEFWKLVSHGIFTRLCSELDGTLIMIICHQ